MKANLNDTNSSSLGSPLRLLLNKNSIFSKNEDHTKAFEKMNLEKAKLTKTRILTSNETPEKKTDASLKGLGVSFEQLHGKTVSSASTFLNSHESKFSTNEFELLGVVWAVEQYKNYLYGSDQNLNFLMIIKLSFWHSDPTMEIKLILVV